MTRTDEIRARLEAATPGRFRRVASSGVDIEFADNARNDLRYLLERADELAAALEASIRYATPSGAEVHAARDALTRYREGTPQDGNARDPKT